MSDPERPEDPPAPSQQFATATAAGTSSAVAISTWWKDFKQESLLFGCVLLILGLLLDIPRSRFIRGVAGNVFSAGIIVILYTLLNLLAKRMQKSSDPRIDRLARWMHLKG